MKWRFAAKFLLSFAALMVLWARIDFGSYYRSAALAVVQFFSPLVNGWQLEHDRPGAVADIVFRSGTSELPMLLQLPALSMGLVPFVSLVVATPGQSAKRMALNVALGSVLYFLIHVLVILAYPLIMDRPSAVKDTLGVFTGLLAFVVAPLGLWFVLTYSALRSLWQLGQEEPEPRRVRKT
ncbi:MAG TPA: hypothetical protein VMW56_02070 [Candidatus Margulisiibacteriota bacterium]|nr:hypothetical protein [Candidatus Margulisiibacteriota bacterium]